ncbi:cytosine deaminase [Ancylobacter sp. A5.8]|uniref:cytosine deaminase n=1 Tax=Ancylobacter gelatini TaxID=2919920 RepID=UPI001F4EDAD5|nr:cytosine deaminase [Ancylobacter gelatini]MCJ8144834.1 cytosine deaminase [Ancylobacter gelatini]
MNPDHASVDLAHPPRHYALTGLRAPACLVPELEAAPDAEGLVALDLAISEGGVSRVVATGTLDADLPRLSMAGALALPGLIDAHTHLDKGFIWPRAPNPDGSFQGAVRAADGDRRANWNAQDVRRRMEFGLRCAYAHGTVAIRTHLDSVGPQTAISWPVFDELRAEWADRIALQAVSLTPIDLVLDDAEFEPMLAAVRHHGGVLGAVTYMGPHLDAGLERLFDAAERFGLDLDFHVDESADPRARSLARIAAVANRRRFAGRILVGHCCSLARQDEAAIDRTLDAVARANIAVVSLPMCNLYLMDRTRGRTPRWRGVTLLHEMAARGIRVMVASDNVRDPFFAYGDLDLIEVYREATRIAHLDHPIAGWPAVVTRAPAKVLGLDRLGLIAPDRRADLSIFRARSLNEFLSRPQADRLVLRAGRTIDTAPPDHAELDDLMGGYDGA